MGSGATCDHLLIRLQAVQQIPLEGLQGSNICFSGRQNKVQGLRYARLHSDCRQGGEPGMPAGGPDKPCACTLPPYRG